jgi:hypothetical protein
MKKVLATLFLLVLMVSSAYAHNGMEHVMETVASITDNSITVTTTDGKSQTVTTTARRISGIVRSTSKHHGKQRLRASPPRKKSGR